MLDVWPVYHRGETKKKMSISLHGCDIQNKRIFHSNAHLDVLSGRDEMIDFSDFLGGPEFSEKLTNPHAVVAKSLNIL